MISPEKTAAIMAWPAFSIFNGCIIKRRREFVQQGNGF
jgi:hypothetical protein